MTPDPWPKVLKQGGGTYTIYQPQLDSWNMYRLEAHAAVSVLSAGAKDPVFGVIEITATTQVHRLLRSVDFTNITVAKATFPSVPQKATQYRTAFQTLLAKGPSTMSLDRLEAALAIQGAEKQAKAVPVKNEPPKFVFAEKQRSWSLSMANRSDGGVGHRAGPRPEHPRPDPPGLGGHYLSPPV